VLVVAALVLGGHHSGSGSNRASATLADLESKLLIIERRVEGIRHLAFTRRPLPTLVSGDEVRKQGLLELDQQMPAAEQTADDELLKLLALIPPGSSLRQIQSAVFQDQVAGFYDPATKKLALVKDTGAEDESVGEITLAHELTHALDDQRFGIKEQAPGMDDGSTAYSALVEGDATSVMTRYATRYMNGSNLLGVLFASSTAGGPRLPPYIQASLEFPYLEGQRFVDTLYRYANGNWKLVNYAFRFRPPVSTAQILNPLEFVRNVKPLPISLRVRPLLPKGWRRATNGTLGEFDTRQLFQKGLPSDRANAAADGWRGGVFDMWRSGPMPRAECPSPCRQHDALVLAWRTAPGRDAQALESAVGTYVTRGLGGRSRGQNLWQLPGSAAAVSSQAGLTVLALAPTPTLAETLAVRAAAIPAPRAHR
jgi:hypothetical protein